MDYPELSSINSIIILFCTLNILVSAVRHRLRARPPDHPRARPRPQTQTTQQPHQVRCEPQYNYLSGTTGQSSNGSRIIQELRHRSTTEASAGSGAAKRILFCTSVVAEAPGSVLASVFTGAPFITGASVAAYLF